MDLTSDFINAPSAYADRLAYAKTHLQKELWSGGPLLHADPFDFERNGFQPGKLSKQRPANTNKKHCYWLDEQDKLLAIRKGLDIPDKFYEEFFFPEDGLLKSCLYSYSPIVGVINVKTRLVQNDRLSELFSLGKHGSKHETYHYEQDKLTKIKTEQWSDEGIGPSFNTIFEYKNGQLREIVNEFENGYKEVMYKVKG